MAVTDSDVDSVAKLIQVEWSNMSSCTCYLSAGPNQSLGVDDGDDGGQRPS